MLEVHAQATHPINELPTPDKCPSCGSTNIFIQHEHTWHSRLSHRDVTDPAYCACKDCNKVTRLSLGKVTGDYHSLY
jgi:ribosomal protein L32